MASWPLRTRHDAWGRRVQMGDLWPVAPAGEWDNVKYPGPPHPKGAMTLVRYDGTKRPGPRNVTLEGVVLLDVRAERVEDGVSYPVLGRDVIRKAPADEAFPYRADLHLATDTELLVFADDAEVVVREYARMFGQNTLRYREAADKLTKLAPK